MASTIMCIVMFIVISTAAVGKQYNQQYPIRFCIMLAVGVASSLATIALSRAGL